LASELYGSLRAAVFTSATLTVPSETTAVQSDFSYFAERVGISLTDQARVRSLALGSPFDYNRQALVCIPSSFPSPKSSDFQKAIEELTGELLQKVKRRTLVLFTSYRMLNQTYEGLNEFANMEGISLLGQGLDGSRSNIVAQFMEYPGAMLLGTESFWEGVDLPGEALEVLLIVKFPFAVPTEPIVAAHIERLGKMGINSFLHYSLPEAVIKFRQGFGRLIRSKTDRGVIVILDTRALVKEYGKVFLDSLPTEVHAFDSIQQMVETIQGWFQDSRQPALQTPPQPKGEGC
jgi:ATP-dependent DNA helicase DinG